MSFQWLIPVWAVALIFIPLLGIAGYSLFRASGTTVRLRWIRRVVMVLLIMVVALRPTIPDPNAPSVRTNVDLFFVVDQTGSMVAEDYDGKKPRMDGVKADLKDLVKQFPGSRFSVIGWGSTASRQLPLTTDTTAVDSWIDTVSQEITAFSDGSSIDRPRDVLFRTLDAERQRSAGNVRLVYFFGDGEQTDPTEVPGSYENCAPYIDGGAVLGYGTEDGGAMRAFAPGTDPDPEHPEYIHDETLDGSPIAISKIDEDNLKKIAQQMGVDYDHRESPSSTKDIAADVDVKALAADGRETQKAFKDLYWIFALGFLALLLWEIWDVGRPSRARTGKEERAQKRAQAKAEREENTRRRAAKDAERAAQRAQNAFTPGGAPGYGPPPGYSSMPGPVPGEAAQPPHPGHVPMPHPMPNQPAAPQPNQPPVAAPPAPPAAPWQPPTGAAGSVPGSGGQGPFGGQGPYAGGPTPPGFVPPGSPRHAQQPPFDPRNPGQQFPNNRGGSQ